MGPAATVIFFNELVQRTTATRDQEHLKVLILNDPTIPDRTAFLLGDGESPIPQLVAGVKSLEEQGADMIVIPCNTAHFFLANLRAAVQIPILDIVQETIESLKKKSSENKKVGLLSTAATAELDLYGPALTKEGFSVRLPDATHQGKINEAIRLIKSSYDLDSGRKLQEETLQHLRNQGVGSAILGCTELGLVEIESPLPLIDSLKTLAESTVKLATHWPAEDNEKKRKSS
jgi:aspartate racemase